jgi:hypothetical protein
MSTVDLSTLPDHIREQILALEEEPTPLFPIAPRELTTTFMQTKEAIEIGQKVDTLIEAVNEIHTWITTGTGRDLPSQTTSATSTSSPKP